MQLRFLLLAGAALLASCSPVRVAERAEPAPPATPLASRPAQPAERQAFFGETHLHTSFSWDAWRGVAGVNITPDQAYRFAQGEPINVDGKMVRRAEPLDFMAVTDHAEYMGVLNQFSDPNSRITRDPALATFPRDRFGGFFKLYYHVHKGRPVPDLDADAGMRNAWAKEVEAANANYRPGRFTTFIAYEWSSMPDGVVNLHRNVIFAGDHAPMPFSVLDSTRPEDLWSYLERNRQAGVEAIAIPHNSNASGGLMFDWVDTDRRPIGEAYAQRRALNEPLVEMSQTKGESETHPALSPTDEFAGFEKWDTYLVSPEKSQPPGSYVRDALGRGLVVQGRAGANPYKLGFVGGSDIHNGLSASAENAFDGSDGGFDPKANMPSAEAVKKAFAPRLAYDFMRERQTNVPENPVRFSGAGLTGVWAEENTRPSIFAALRRRETFATSGTRVKIRVFGGWDYRPELLNKPGWAGLAYGEGVPMGSDLPAAPKPGAAPQFVLWALKDPNGANLDRIQVVKVWLEGGQYKEKVFNVSWSGANRERGGGALAPVGDTVNVKTATYQNTIGAAELKTVWRDPEFNPRQAAVYYARVLEIPTPRWSTYLAAAHGLPLPTTAPATIQERGWSSPIWYTPPARVAAR